MIGNYLRVWSFCSRGQDHKRAHFLVTAHFTKVLISRSDDGYEVQVLIAAGRAVALERVPSRRAAACGSLVSVGCRPRQRCAGARRWGEQNCTSISLRNPRVLGAPHLQLALRAGRLLSCAVLAPSPATSRLGGRRGARHAGKTPRAFAWGEV